MLNESGMRVNILAEKYGRLPELCIIYICDRNDRIRNTKIDNRVDTDRDTVLAGNREKTHLY